MDSVSRVIRAFLNGLGWKLGVVAVVLLVAVSNAFSYGPVSSQTNTVSGYCFTGSSPAICRASFMALAVLDFDGFCPAHPARSNCAFDGVSSVGTSSGLYSFHYTEEASRQDRVRTVAFYRAPVADGTTCPPNATSGGSACLCDAGYKNLSGNGCKPYVCNTSSSATFESDTPIPSGTFCADSSYGVNAGCVYQSGQVAVAKLGTTSTYVGQDHATAGFCQESTSGAGHPVEPPQLSQAEKCALGNAPPMCAATVNGASVCVVCDSSKSTTTTETASPSGAASAPTGTTPGTSTTTTECNGGACTTTTTVKDTSGNTVGTTRSTGAGVGGSGSGRGTGDTEPKPGLCDQYPNIPACKSGSFSGSCSAGAAAINCDGDAVQCSVAREQFRRQCEFFEKTSDASAAAIQAASDGTGGASDHPAKNPTAIALGSFDQTDLLPGSCPADRSLMIGAATVSLPFSKVCAPASQLGSLLVALTALACVAIVFKGA